MKYIQKMIKAVFLMLICLGFCVSVSAASEAGFQGAGTKDDPYQIGSYEDLCRFRDNVNNGKEYENVYFSQTADIDLQKKEWTPIGVGGCRFMGTYDGGGHSIENLVIQNKKKDIAYGFFSSLGGCVANIKLANGDIKGDLSGGIAGTAVGDKACIINCYSNVHVKGMRSGGIAGNFRDGYIVGCINTGEIQGKESCSIVGSSSSVKVYASYSTGKKKLMQKDVVSATSDTIEKSDLTDDGFVKKLNVLSGLSGYLYKNFANVQIKQWQIENNELTYSDATTWSTIWGFVNYNLLLLLLLIYIVYFVVKRYRNKDKNFWEMFHKEVKANCLIFGIVSVFLDTALFTRTILDLRIGNSLFVILSNLIAVYCLIMWILHAKFHKIVKPMQHIPFLIVVVICIVLQIVQFNVVPKYDASLYYGSLMEGAKQFNMGLLSYLGNFVCWKWIHGLALFLAPFEFIAPASIRSVYLANIFITVITLFLLYNMLKGLYVKITPLISALVCAYLVLCPYSVGMMSYLCMDIHLVFFGIWLMYAIYKRNPMMIGFCGFLLTYTKITGMVFYVFVLAVMVLYELSDIEEYGLIKSFCVWFKPGKVLTYISPILTYMIFFVVGDYFTIQSFLGTYVSDTAIKLKTGVGMLNIIFQSFIFGFRWLIPAIILIIGICAIKKARNVQILTQDGLRMLTALVIGSLFVFIMFCIYNGDAECPRYTAIFNVLFTFLFAFMLGCIRKKSVLQKVIAFLVVILLAVQTFVSIDPFVVILSEPIKTGKVKLYKHAMPNDDRDTMVLRAEDDGKPSESDLYVHNLEYFYEDDLIDQMLKTISPKNERFYVLDMLEYELHISGSYHRQYKIYWDPDKQCRTYNDQGTDKEYVNVTTITTTYLTSEKFKYFVSSNNRVYLIVPARIKEKEALGAIQKCGYDITNRYKFENMYGYMTVYEVTSQKDFEY